MSRFLDGANRTAQYYQAKYPGASTFSRLEKFLLHTTETRGWPGYGGGASAPNATYYPERREIRQHFDNNRSARALRDPSNTVVRENRDNIFQLEIICYSDKRLGDSVGGLWVGDLTDTHMRDIAAMILQLHEDWDLPVQSSVTWREGRQTYYDDVRLSGPQFDAYRGILGHVHASGNSHWDPGGFRYSKLKPHLSTGDSMSWNETLEPTSTAAKRFPDGYTRRAGKVLMHVLGLSYQGVFGKIAPNGWMKARWSDMPDEGYSPRVYWRSGYGHARQAKEEAIANGKQLGKLAGEVAGLRNAVEQLATGGGQPVDMAAVQSAALAGAQAAMAELSITVTVEPAEEPDGSEPDPTGNEDTD